jgi:hypothetical protein
MMMFGMRVVAEMGDRGKDVLGHDRTHDRTGTQKIREKVQAVVEVALEGKGDFR